MAKIRTGSLAGNIRGSIGADTFSQNRYGTYVRRRAIPTKVITQYTQKVRSIFAYLVSIWQNMDDEARSIWDIYAQGNPVSDSMGQQQILSGFNTFIGLNTRLMYINSGPVFYPPNKKLIEAVNIVGFSIEQDEELDWTVKAIVEKTGQSEANVTHYIEGAYFVSGGKKYVENLYRFIGLCDGTEIGTTGKIELVFTSDWINRFGTPQYGYWASIKICRINKETGDMSVKSVLSSPVTIIPPL